MRRETEETIRCASFIIVCWGYIQAGALAWAHLPWWFVFFYAAGVFPLFKVLYWLLEGKRWTE